MIVVTAAQMQTMDRRTIEEFGIPGRVLMENAGRGATRSFLDRVYLTGAGRVGVMAGRGNNGGDGFVMARYLAQRDIDVKVFLLSTIDLVQGDAAANLNLLSAMGVPVVEIPDADSFSAQLTEMRHMAYWIDAVLGTGLKSNVRGYYRQVIEFINSTRRPVLAVDIPSGLDADTGQPRGVSIRAGATATFAFAKIGHVLYPGAQYCGAVDVIDIGIPSTISAKESIDQQLITGQHIQTILAQRPPEMHKGGAGHTLIVAGATGKTGAATMATTSALRSGAGLVTLGIAQSLYPILASQLIEAMTAPLPDENTGFLTEKAYASILNAAEGKQVMALGPGLGTNRQTGELVHRMLKEIDLPMVIDADGLNHLAGHLDCLAGRKAATVLTPHPGEMARLANLSVADIQNNRVAAARKLATHCRVHVVLKGARTVVAEPDGAVWINPTGNPGMASGGMGDVLTGLIAGLVAQGCTATQASLAGVYLHGLAADILGTQMPWGYLAREVMDTIPSAIQRVINDPPLSPLKDVFM